MNDKMDKYILAIKYINIEQEKIIGKNIAGMIARNISGLKYDTGSNPIIEGKPVEVLSNLVDGYATIFGRASLQVSKNAIKKVSPAFDQIELPENLK